MPYETDAEHEAAVLEAFEYAPTPEDDARAQAGADGRMVAMETTRRYHEMELPSRIVRFGMGGTPLVRKMVSDVMIQQHRGFMRTVEEYQPKMPGVWLPTFDEHNPEHSRGWFVVFAGKPTVAHSMRFDRLEDLLERSRQTKCAWGCLANVFCAGHTRDVWCFHRGQYLVVVPTCFECRQWHMSGAPDMDKWGAYKNRRKN